MLCGKTVGVGGIRVIDRGSNNMQTCDAMSGPFREPQAMCVRPQDGRGEGKACERFQKTLYNML